MYMELNLILNWMYKLQLFWEISRNEGVINLVKHFQNHINDYSKSKNQTTSL